MSNRGGRGGRGGNGGNGGFPRGGFGSPVRGGRGGASFQPADGFAAQQGFQSPQQPRGGGRGGGRGGRGGFTSPQFGGSPSYPRGGGASGGAPGFQTPQRANSAGLARGGGYSGGRGGFHQPKFGSPSPSAPSRSIALGDFTLDERLVKGPGVALSLKMGAAGFDDAHVDSVLLPFLRDTLEPYLRANYLPHYRREAVQLNLELQDNYFTSLGLERLALALQQALTAPDTPYRLAALKLWNNQIGDEGCEALARLLVLAARADAPLVELHLSHNQVTERGAAAIFNAVYEYSRADCSLTKLDVRGNVAVASAPRPVAAGTDVFVLPRNCADTGQVLSPPLYPLWLRLEWNVIESTRFAPYFRWLSLQPDAVRKAAKRERKAALKAAAAAAGDAAAGMGSLQSESLASSAATEADGADDEDESRDDDGAQGDEEADAEQEQEEQGEDDEQSEQMDDDAAGEDDDGADVADAMAGLSLDPSQLQPASDANGDAAAAVGSNSVSFRMPPASFRICPVANRSLCSVRTCCYGSGAVAHCHLCFFHLQHQRYQDSDLLGALKKQRKQARAVAATAKAQTKPPLAPATEVAAVPAPVAPAARPASSSRPVAPVPVMPASAVAAAASAAIPVPSAVPAPSPSPSSMRPLVLFLDSNAVFAMISARAEARTFHWDNLLRLAIEGRFGACFPEEERRVYVVLCSAVLNEMDARKEYSKKASEEGGHFGAQRFAHLSVLARQIKAQFQLNAADPSQGFLARAKNLGGLGKGFLKTVSVAQGEMNVHPSLRPSPGDNRNTSNDRRILNAALHWSQSLGETGCVVLLTEDRNLAALAATEDLPTASLYALDRALSAPTVQGRPIDSVLMREALASCSRELSESMSAEAARPAPRQDKNVYEALADALALLEQAAVHPERKVERSDDEIEALLDQWRGVLANAPQLLTALRSSQRNNHGSPAPVGVTSPVR